MSIKVMATIWDQSSHEGSTLLLLLALADHASDDGVCWPGIPRLARKARKTERHTKRLLTKLEESGELYVARGAGRGNTNMYYITLGFSEDEMVHTLIKRFEFNPDKAAHIAGHIARLQGKGDAQDTFLDIRGKVKGDIQEQEKVTPRAQKVTPMSQKGDIAMSPEPSLTIIKPSVENQEKDDFSEKTKKADPLSFDLDRRTLENKENNYAVPAQAGGAFTLGDVLTTVACARLGRSEPKGKKHDSALAFFEKALKTEGLLQGEIATLTRAVRNWLDPEGEYAFFLPQYDLNPKHKLALRHFGIVLSKAKKQTDAPDHRAADVEATELSLAALEERRATRPPPPRDNEMGRQVKAELRLQIPYHTFRQYVEPSGFTCDDGVLMITAPNDFTRDWIENRLSVTIKRALAGVAGGPQEIIFEVKDDIRDPA